MAETTITCDCASVAPTMPVYRDLHLWDCPITTYLRVQQLRATGSADVQCVNQAKSAFWRARANFDSRDLTYFSVNANGIARLAATVKALREEKGEIADGLNEISYFLAAGDIPSAQRHVTELIVRLASPSVPAEEGP